MPLLPVHSVRFLGFPIDVTVGYAESGGLLALARRSGRIDVLSRSTQAVVQRFYVPGAAEVTAIAFAPEAGFEDEDDLFSSIPGPEGGAAGAPGAPGGAREGAIRNANATLYAATPVGLFTFSIRSSSPVAVTGLGGEEVTAMAAVSLPAGDGAWEPVLAAGRLSGAISLYQLRRDRSLGGVVRVFAEGSSPVTALSFLGGEPRGADSLAGFEASSGGDALLMYGCEDGRVSLLRFPASPQGEPWRRVASAGYKFTAPVSALHALRNCPSLGLKTFVFAACGAQIHALELLPAGGLVAYCAVDTGAPICSLAAGPAMPARDWQRTPGERAREEIDALGGGVGRAGSARRGSRGSRRAASGRRGRPAQGGDAAAVSAASAASAEAVVSAVSVGGRDDAPAGEDPQTARTGLAFVLVGFMDGHIRAFALRHSTRNAELRFEHAATRKVSPHDVRYVACAGRTGSYGAVDGSCACFDVAAFADIQALFGTVYTPRTFLAQNTVVAGHGSFGEIATPRCILALTTRGVELYAIPGLRAAVEKAVEEGAARNREGARGDLVDSSSVGAASDAEVGGDTWEADDTQPQLCLRVPVRQPSALPWDMAGASAASGGAGDSRDQRDVDSGDSSGDSDLQASSLALGGRGGLAGEPATPASHVSCLAISRDSRTIALSDAASGRTRIIRNDFDADIGYTGSVELGFAPGGSAGQASAISLPAADFLLIHEHLLFGFAGNAMFVVQTEPGGDSDLPAADLPARSESPAPGPALEFLGLVSPLFTISSAMGGSARVVHACADGGVLYAVDGLGSRLASVSIDSLSVLQQARLPPLVAGLPQLVALSQPADEQASLLVLASCGTVLRFAPASLAYLGTAVTPSTSYDALGFEAACTVKGATLALQGGHMLDCGSGRRFFLGKDAVAVLGVEDEELGIVYCQPSDLERQLPLPSAPARGKR